MSVMGWCRGVGVVLFSCLSLAVARGEAEIELIEVGGQPTHVLCDERCERIFVLNTVRNSVAVIRTSDNRVVQEITTGLHPNHMALAPNRRQLLVLNQNEPSLSILAVGGGATDTIDAGTARKIKFDRATTATSISVQRRREGPEFKAYASVYDSSALTGYIAVIDLETATVVKRITYSSFAYNSIGCPYGNAVTPDGELLYVNVQCVGALGRRGHDPIYVYSTKHDLPVAVISFARNPHVGSGIAVHPDGTEVWSAGGNACSLADYRQQDEAGGFISGCDASGHDPITIIDTATHTINGQVFFGSAAYLSFTPDKKYILVPQGETLALINTKTRAKEGSIPVGGASSGAVAFSADGSRAFVPLSDKGVVAVVDFPAAVAASR